MAMKRNTWQREAVRAALGRNAGFVSAQELHTRMREDGSPIGLATVYRALADLAEEGTADSLLSDSGESLFRVCATGGHHHHLICRLCGETVEIEAGAVEEWARATAAEHGYTEPAHVIDIFGVCPRCRAGRPQQHDLPAPPR